MPHIATAMHNSLVGGSGDAMMYSLLRSRTINEQVSTVKNTFSSWDNCMSQVYCKWPVVVALLIAGLIVFSIITCVVRCMCLGYSCCCTCFSCLKCCACCGGCCDGRRSKPMKYMDESSSYDTKGYQAPIPMMRGAQQEAPKFARFSVMKSGGNNSGVSEDALPAMPSWETASKKHILADDEEERPANLISSNAQNIPLVSAAAATGMSSPSIQGRSDPAPFPPRPAQTPANGYYNSAPAAPSRGYTGSPNSQVPYMANGPGYRGPTPQLPSQLNFTPMSPRFPPERIGSPVSSIRGHQAPLERMGSPASGIRGYQVPPERMGSPASGIRGYQAPPERMGSPASGIRGYQAPPERQMYPSPSSNLNYQNADRQQFNQPRGPSRGPAPYPGYGAY